MTLYNETFIDTANTWVDIFGGLDNLAPGLLGGLIVFALVVVMISSAKNRDWGSLLLAAGFVSTIVAGYFWMSGLVQIKILEICVVFLIISLIAKKWLDDNI